MIWNRKEASVKQSKGISDKFKPIGVPSDIRVPFKLPYSRAPIKVFIRAPLHQSLYENPFT